MLDESKMSEFDKIYNKVSNDSLFGADSGSASLFGKDIKSPFSGESKENTGLFSFSSNDKKGDKKEVPVFQFG